VAHLTDDLGWALGAVFRAYAKAAGEAVGEVPGGPRGYLVLAAAVQQVATNQGALGQHLGIDRTVLTYLLDDLEKAGLVERRPDPADRRSRRVVATDKGREVLAGRQEVLRKVEAHVLGVLGGDEPAFRAMLQRVAAHAHALDPMRNACDAAEQADC
jgi:DNA-binding MarR family transcriptional regulator